MLILGENFKRLLEAFTSELLYITLYIYLFVTGNNILIAKLEVLK